MDTNFVLRGNKMKLFLPITSFLFLTACIAISPKPEAFIEKEIQTSNFSIAVWEKETIQSGKTLRIYIEGDGNPNPRHLLALDFAERDTTPNVIYIARPCQWTNDKICKQKPNIYGQDRFHEEIMREMQELIYYLLLLLLKYSFSYYSNKQEWGTFYSNLYLF